MVFLNPAEVRSFNELELNQTIEILEGDVQVLHNDKVFLKK